MAMAYTQDVKPSAVVTAEDLDANVEKHVEIQFRGTDEDKLDMKVLGRTQETRRIFNWITMLGFGSTLMVTWEVILANIYAILSNGGTAGMFWGFLIVVAGYLLVYASLAEMSSMVSTVWHSPHPVVKVKLLNMCNRQQLLAVNTTGSQNLRHLQHSDI